MSLEQLLHQVRACQVCHQELPLGAKPILQASQNSKILIAGQAPGKITHHKGRPFDDPSGKRLRNWLGVDEASFYDANNFAILPMGFCFPGGFEGNMGKRGDKPPPQICASLWQASLLNQLPNIELTLVLGQYAMAYHLGSHLSLTQGVENWRDYWPQKVILPHPSPRNNIWLKKNPFFEAEVLPVLKAKISSILR